MAKEENFSLPDLSGDVSRQALSIARMIDRFCQRPGEYHIRITVPFHSRRPWIIDLYKVERLQSFNLHG